MVKYKLRFLPNQVHPIEGLTWSPMVSVSAVACCLCKRAATDTSSIRLFAGSRSHYVRLKAWMTAQSLPLAIGTKPIEGFRVPPPNHAPALVSCRVIHCLALRPTRAADDLVETVPRVGDLRVGIGAMAGIGRLCGTS
jgi:hypothetical protein